MKRIWLLLLVIVILGVGCFGHTPKPFHYVKSASVYQQVPYKVIPVYVDKYFGAADKLSIDDSIKQWNFALNGMIQIKVISYDFDMEPEILRSVVNGGGWVILKIDSSNPMIDDGPYVNGKPEAYTAAWVNAIGGNRMWVIRDRIANGAVSGITLHEMGHLLGAEHDQVYLMQAKYNWEDFRCVDYQSAKRVAAYQMLPLGRMNYCEYGALANIPN